MNTTLTTRMAATLWIHCHTIGSAEGVRMADQARKDLLAGRFDSQAVTWATTMYGQIPADARKAAEGQIDYSL